MKVTERVFTCKQHGNKNILLVLAYTISPRNYSIVYWNYTSIHRLTQVIEIVDILFVTGEATQWPMLLDMTRDECRKVLRRLGKITYIYYISMAHNFFYIFKCIVKQIFNQYQTEKIQFLNIMVKVGFRFFVVFSKGCSWTLIFLYPVWYIKLYGKSSASHVWNVPKLYWNLWSTFYTKYFSALDLFINIIKVRSYYRFFPLNLSCITDINNMDIYLVTNPDHFYLATVLSTLYK